MKADISKETMDIDISRLSQEKFMRLVGMCTRYQDKLDGGISYSSAFSVLEGPKPIASKKYVIQVDDDMNTDIGPAQEFAKNTPEKILYIMEKRGETVGFMVLPEAVSRETPHIKKIPSGGLN